jgi:fatty-acyl-CoA synthase
MSERSGAGGARGPGDHHLWDVFDAVAAAHGDRTGIVFRRERRSYADLRSRARRFADFLCVSGLGSRVEREHLQPWEIGQDVVALYLLNGPEYLEVALGSYSARAVPANVNYRYTAEELTYLLQDCASSVIVYHARFAPTVAETLPRLTNAPRLVQVADESDQPLLPGAVDYETLLGAHQDRPVEPVGGPARSDDIYLLYTGGTTGMPKGTLWTHADIFDASLGGPLAGHDLEQIVALVGERDPSAMMPIAPLMHGGAQWTALAALLGGDTVVLNSVADRLDPADVWSLVERERVCRMMLIGEALARPLADELERVTYDTSSLGLLVMGGAITSPETKARLIRLIPGVRVADVAGASETGNLLSAVSSSRGITDAGVFKAGPTTVVIDDDRQRVLEPGHGGVGWVAKHGAIPLGYLGDPAKTAATFPTLDGVRYTVPGDRAEWLADGSIRLLGRDSVTINSGGEKVFAEEVEQAILRNPDVEDVVVCGRPSQRWGQEVIALVALRDGAARDEAQLLGAIAGLARYKLPKAVVWVEAVRRNAVGKPDYAWARQVAVEAPAI